MLDLTKMYIYRLFHSKALIRMSLFLLAVACLLLWVKTGEATDLQKTNPSVRYPLYKVFVTGLGNGIFFLTITIYTAIFCHSDQKNGFIKNIAGCVSDRSLLILSKFVAVICQVFLMMAVFFGSTVIMAMTVFHGKFKLDIFQAGLWQSIGIYFFVFLAMASLIMLCTTLARSGSIGTIIGMVIMIGIPEVVFGQLLPLIASHFHLTMPPIYRYLLEYIVNLAGPSAKESDHFFAFWVAVGWIIAANGITIIVMKRRDIQA